MKKSIFIPIVVGVAALSLAIFLMNKPTIAPPATTAVPIETSAPATTAPPQTTAVELTVAPETTPPETTAPKVTQPPETTPSETTPPETTSPRPAMDDAISIFMYHEVGIPSAENYFFLEPENMEGHLKYLQDNGYHTVTMSQIADHWTEGTPLPEKPVALTFDDGYLSMYDTVLPLMQQYNATATFFIITGHMEDAGFLNADMLREMRDAGMEIGSHARIHLNMTEIDMDEVTQQLTDSKATLEEILGEPIRSFCYPYGGHNDAVIAAVEAAGYDSAVTTELGDAKLKQGIYNLDRHSIGFGDDAASLAKRLCN